MRLKRKEKLRDARRRLGLVSAQPWPQGCIQNRACKMRVTVAGENGP